jgi:hypothetical protein
MGLFPIIVSILKIFNEFNENTPLGKQKLSQIWVP